jgi:alkanesulfonate monooxygenase SsuD/methylene tetrahydromethanopterin reductase-like flavin-dependent oxidoreductase (luciferase family)
VHRVPFLVGGHSPVALRRAGRIGDGWLAQQSFPELDPGELSRAIAVMHAAAAEAGREVASLEVVLRIVEASGRSAELAERLPELAAAGVGEIIVDVSLEGGVAPEVYRSLAEASA